MTCAFDSDLIALYAGGDAPPGDAALVEEHLASCPACRARLEEHRQGMDLMREHQREVRYPHAAVPARRALRPVWRLAVAAVVLLGALGAAGVYTESPAVAALLKTFGLVQVKELNKEEARAFEAKLRADLVRQPGPQEITYDDEGKGRDASGQVVSVRSTMVTFEEAERAVDYRLLKPGYLPEGFPPSFASIFLNNRQGDVVFAYGGGSLTIHQTAPRKEPFRYIDLPEGATETVQVAGEPALVIRGSWGAGHGPSGWRPEVPVTLLFSRGEQVIRIVAGQIGFPTEELIKIAESLQ